MSMSLAAATRPASGTVGAPRVLLAIAVAGAIAAGFLATGSDASAQAVSQAGADLTRLLRAMAMLKAMMAAGVVAALWWRLGSPVSPARFAAYMLACAAMAAGPGLIWGMAHVGAGALALHAGLLASILLLWRDREVASRLRTLVAARRLALRE